MAKASESSKGFLSLMRRWQLLEDATIKSAESMLNRTRNPLIRFTMESIKQDSAKHKKSLQMIIDSLNKEAVHLSPDELGSLVSMLNKHIDIEAKSIEMAKDAKKESKLFITKYLLSQMLSDEIKHHAMLKLLINELKKASVASSSGVRSRKTR